LRQRIGLRPLVEQHHDIVNASEAVDENAMPFTKTMARQNDRDARNAARMVRAHISPVARWCTA
jgi:hypothetical protein